MTIPLLEVKNLKTHFKLSQNTVYAVNGVSFRVDKGEVLGIVGESGCGKSVSALSIMRLIEEPGKIIDGQVLLHDESETIDLVKQTPTQLVKIRGNRISMIFQDPMTCLNPVYSIGFQLAEPLKIHRHLSEEEARNESIRLLTRVGIPEPAQRLKDFPHQLSGGMRQRVMIAMAVACRPNLLIADEPTTALDVTIQAQIIDLIRDLKDEIGTSVIIITHDLGVIAEMANFVTVMYAGIVVESGPVRSIFNSPLHPYTKALMLSVPKLSALPEKLHTIEGMPPSLTKDITACPFYPRCQYRIEQCEQACPSLLKMETKHEVACWVAQKGGSIDV